ncbi:sodium/sugar symporter [Umboniibacter marinipuniceus]|uniref:SSS family solute:Na+ symporter n=1 Tax=Umboniibacter marinipuniceus TaxID=569599 RepID=A0A3M0A7J0_9GAMM|nr:sodium/sugar symporter [Umboniibacter marinipuniceus]RMA79509.1 SSS family solute:Na+ symporter [Umboniibacter marinipuniceus]
MQLQTLDLWVAAIYAIALIGIATYVSREKAGHEKDTSDYFLAGRGLPWWAIGASLIAANISAEQIIGMSGSAYVMGMAIASYEWMAAITLIIVGKYFLPIFLKHEIYTMPQFLEQRYNHAVRTVMAVFWLGVYIFVNLTSILWLGALAINSVTGLDLNHALVVLALFTAAYSLYGGLKAVALTDIIQVVLLVAGGLFLAYLSLDAIAINAGGTGAIQGFGIMLNELPGKFDMILDPSNPSYISLPGISVLVGGMWIMNLSYWGFNQYIIQRALAAKDVREAQKGIVFAAFLKLLMPIIVVLPGIAAVMLLPDLDAPDKAYPELMKLLPVGIKGVVFAALIAAIVSSLASMVNSISTIFTMDMYTQFSKKTHTQKQLVTVGRTVGMAALILAVIIARPLLGNFDQAFQYIQEFTGFFTPGIVAIFFMGMFWKKASAAGALTATVGSAALSLLLKIFWETLPFMDRVGVVFIACMVLGVIFSLLFPNKKAALDNTGISFATDKSFNVAAVAVSLILIALYAAWW